MREQVIHTVIEVELKKPTQESSPTIRLSLLLELERGVKKWHVACRRGFLTAEGEIDYGGKGTYIEDLSKQDVEKEWDARAYFQHAFVALTSGGVTWSTLV